MKKRIRINSSVIELNEKVITVYRKGEVIKTVNTNGYDDAIHLQAECAAETMYYINK